VLRRCVRCRIQPCHAALRRSAQQAWARHVVACGKGTGASEDNVVEADFDLRREAVA